jgi:amidase
MRIAFFTDNGIVSCSQEITGAIRACAKFLSESGHEVVEIRPPAIDQAYELELALLGADGCDDIEAYLNSAGSTQRHPLLEDGFLSRMRPFRCTLTEFASRWKQWDDYRTRMTEYFRQHDAVLCPVYAQPALKHGESVKPGNFEGFSYTMAWNVSGNPAATVRVAEVNGLPINIQVATGRWHDMLALEICQMLEQQFGGWQPPPNI